jgi:hypothetical protein
MRFFVLWFKAASYLMPRSETGTALGDDVDVDGDGDGAEAEAEAAARASSCRRRCSRHHAAVDTEGYMVSGIYDVGELILLLLLLLSTLMMKLKLKLSIWNSDSRFQIDWDSNFEFRIPNSGIIPKTKNRSIFLG